MTSKPAMNHDPKPATVPVLVPKEAIEKDTQKTMVGKVQNSPQRVKAVYEGEQIKSIVVTCQCGNVMNIECEY